MPKSTKKKKDKAADFTKAKLKLGKGKQTPSNVVDTSFKARSIALPSQSIATEKDADAPTTKRRLTFDALIAHTKHYNAATRRDAILGLRELFDAHPELISVHLTTLVNNCVRLIGDEDSSVRKGLLAFFGWLFRQVPVDELTPHSAVLLLFTTSAQTHIFPEIRIDAIRFLDIYLECIPEVVTDGWMHPGSGSHGRRVLEGYLGILNAGTTFGEGGDSGPAQATSTASVVLSPASKLVVLKSLATFLSHAITSAWQPHESSHSSSSTTSTPSWYFQSSFASSSAFETFDAVLRPSSIRLNSDPAWHWSAEVSASDDIGFCGPFPLASNPVSDKWALSDLANIDTIVSTLRGQGETGGGAEIACVTHLSRTLHSMLVSTFLDCAPTVFSPSSAPPEIEMQMVLVVCRICRSLYGKILQDSTESGTIHEAAEADLQTILSYLSPYFPFTITGLATAKRDMKAEQTFQDLCLIFCELSSFLVLASQRNRSRPPAKSQARGQPKRTRATHPAPSVVHPRQIEHVSAYIIQLLQGQAPSSGVPSSLPRPITPQAYVALLPTIWSLVNAHSSDSEDTAATLFGAVLEHANRASSTSAVKRHTIEFIGRMVLLDREPEYVGVFRIGQSSEVDAKLHEWILQLPKTLWELGSNHLATSETVVRLLMRLVQRRSPMLQPGTYTALCSRLAPYFTITHPSRGKLPGPFTKLPPSSRLRHLVLDLVASIVSQGTSAPSEQAGLRNVVTDCVRDTPDATYWAGILNRAQ